MAAGRGGLVVRIGWKRLLEQLCINLHVPPPEFNCSSTAGDRHVASVTVQYRKPEDPKELCVETLTGEPKDSEDEAIDWVSERAIERLQTEWRRLEMHADRAKRRWAEMLRDLKKLGDLIPTMREEGEHRDNPRFQQMLDSFEQLISNAMEQENKDGSGGP
ncbi:hypothetical protein EJB05_43252, partial [Eragrostis curvula]